MKYIWKKGEYDGEKYDRRETFKIDTGFYVSGFMRKSISEFL